MRNIGDAIKIYILAGLFGAMLVGAMLLPPIPVDPAYHDFADKRPLLGIPNFGDVISNLPFAVFGVMGLALVLGQNGRRIFESRFHAWPYLVFFGAVTLVFLGSGYYHWVPSNGPLYWDRAPIAIAFMGLFAAFLADRIDQRVGVMRLLPLLIALSTAALCWDWTHFDAGGDLRFYAMVQVYPLVALPLLCWFYPEGRYTRTGYAYLMLGWYVLAKTLELADRTVFDLLRGTVSGHTLKHLAAALAVYTAIAMLRAAGNAAASGTSGKK